MGQNIKGEYPGKCVRCGFDAGGISNMEIVAEDNGICHACVGVILQDWFAEERDDMANVCPHGEPCSHFCYDCGDP